MKDSMPPDIVDRVTRGDFHLLSERERSEYYVYMCERLCLDPGTRPFDWLTRKAKDEQGKWYTKMILYASKSCASQLRSKRGISVVEMVRSKEDGLLIVQVKIRDKDGREEIELGAVPSVWKSGSDGQRAKQVRDKTGEDLANAWMAASTKAKRRATLSMHGLGLLDETEVQSMVSMGKGEIKGGTKAYTPPPPPTPEPAALDTPAKPQATKAANPRQSTQSKPEAALKDDDWEIEEEALLADYMHDLEAEGGNVTTALRNQWRKRMEAYTPEQARSLSSRIISAMVKNTTEKIG